MYGTNTTLDALASNSSVQSVMEFGEQRAYDAIEAAFEAHNAIADEMLTELVERTTDAQRVYGGNDDLVMDELDQYGTPDAQKAAAGQTLGFPLRKYGGSIQWTLSALQVMTPQDLAKDVNGIMSADMRVLQREIKRAIFYPTNVTFVDVLVKNVSLAVKRFLNADSVAIPLGPNGESFTAASHTHYIYTAGTALAVADVVALITAVVEHASTGEARVYINRAQETAMRALTGFTAYVDTRLIQANSALATRTALDPMLLNNRAIGIFSSGGISAEVWVKPWVPSGYLFAFLRGGNRPLVMRQRAVTGNGDLRLVFEDELHPLRARTYEREFGIGVWQRANGAALFLDAATASAYTAPTIS